jgi:hypothetical protein
MLGYRGRPRTARDSSYAWEYALVVAHVFEPATSGRSKCRGCGRPIAKGELRFGESVPNLFAEGDTTLWFHPSCAAHKRPQALLEALEQTPDGIPDRDELLRAANKSDSSESMAPSAPRPARPSAATATSRSRKAPGVFVWCFTTRGGSRPAVSYT